MKKTLFALAAAATLAVAATASFEPASAAGRWRLDFEPGEFTYVVVGPNDGTGKVEYYLPYTVSNGSADAVNPRLRLEVRTETKKTFGDRFSARAYKAIAKSQRKKSVSSTFQLRETSLEKGNSASAAAHFGAMDDHADELEVRVYGLWNPVYVEKDGKRWRENRYLSLKYRRYGDEYRRYEDKIELLERNVVVEPGSRKQIVHPRDR